MQMYGKFERFPLSTLGWVGNTMTPCWLSLAIEVYRQASFWLHRHWQPMWDLWVQREQSFLCRRLLHKLLQYAHVSGWWIRGIAQPEFVKDYHLSETNSQSTWKWMVGRWFIYRLGFGLFSGANWLLVSGSVGDQSLCFESSIAESSSKLVECFSKWVFRSLEVS